MACIDFNKYYSIVKFQAISRRVFCIPRIMVIVAAAAMFAATSAFAASIATPVTLGGIIHSDSDDTLAFTPDGSTVFFDRSEGPHKTVMIAHRVANHWSKPEVASFSGQWFDQDPVVSPDGSYMLFNSDRPTPRSGGKSLKQNYFSGGATAPGSNIWRVDRTANGWGKPVWLGATINSDVFIDFASIAGDNTLYFMRWNVEGRAMQFWRSVYKNGQYQSPERVVLGEPSETLHDPAVAPDQTFIVFDSGKVKGGLARLNIAFRDGGHWGEPIDLGDDLNKDLPWGSHLAPDGHNVYVTGNSGIKQISLDPWLKVNKNNKRLPL